MGNNLKTFLHSGSSSGSSSIPHSFSVDEIQKGRLQLKSSKSYPDDFLKKSKNLDIATLDDGDNSSSGVSSDQEILPTTSNDCNEMLVSEQSNIITNQLSKSQRHQTGNKPFVETRMCFCV